MPRSASRLIRWSDVRAVRRALAVPLVGSLVGLFLTAASVGTATPRPRDSWPFADQASASVDAPAHGILASSSVELQRGAPYGTSDVFAETASDFELDLDATAAVEHRSMPSRATSFARGYDATAPPHRLS